MKIGILKCDVDACQMWEVSRRHRSFSCYRAVLSTLQVSPAEPLHLMWMIL